MSHVGKGHMLVAYLGPPSSYTHQVATEFFDAKLHRFQDKETIKGKRYQPPLYFVVDIADGMGLPDVFLAVQSSPAILGVVPIENSSNGAVDCTLDCLIDRDNETPDVMVCKETYLDVKHSLLGRKSDASVPSSPAEPSGHLTSPSSVPDPSTPPSRRLRELREITDVYSHPQALGQCRVFLSTYLKQAKQHEVSSTSQAASLVAQGPSSPAAVAIASGLAAEVYGLDIVATDIQDRNDNATRFIILVRRDGPQCKLSESTEVTRCKALVTFSVANDAGGTLADALQLLERSQCTLTNIEKRPDRLEPWHYRFVVEYECAGSAPEINIRIRRALEDLGNVTRNCRRLGCWQE
ncbi:MAG: hypothetical protein Q9163_003824 [Psora crenata]